MTLGTLKEMEQRRLIKEISDEKLSWKVLAKAIELYALMIN